MLHALLRRRTRNGDRSLEADDEPPSPADAHLPIGLALSGGAARAFAHIGVLQTFAAHGLQPDVIAGTSMGAVIGGCYAAGKLDELAAWARTLTRRRVLRYLDVSLAGSGLIGGDRLARVLERTVGHIKIEALVVRFAAIATEIETGHEVWLTRGRLLEALRASYALPGMFAPVRIGGRWLVDGALVNPVPVSAARSLDARLVIGVNTNADLFGRGTTIHDQGFDVDDDAPQENHNLGGRARGGIERLLKRRLFAVQGRPSLPTVMVEAYNVMQDRITRARLAGDPADIMVSPRLGHIGMFDFHRAAEAIEIGAEAAERALETIGHAIEALA